MGPDCVLRNGLSGDIPSLTSRMWKCREFCESSFMRNAEKSISRISGNQITNLIWPTVFRVSPTSRCQTLLFSNCVFGPLFSTKTRRYNRRSIPTRAPRPAVFGLVYIFKQTYLRSRAGSPLCYRQDPSIDRMPVISSIDEVDVELPLLGTGEAIGGSHASHVEMSNLQREASSQGSVRSGLAAGIANMSNSIIGAGIIGV